MRRAGQTKLTRSHRRYRLDRRDPVRLDQPLCPVCQAKGYTVAGVEVDHIVPISQGGSLMDRANLQHLCVPCHEAKTRQQRPRRRAGATVHGDLVRPGGGESTAAGVGGNRCLPEVFRAAKLSDARTEA